jgi:hypothetical protein
VSYKRSPLLSIPDFKGFSKDGSQGMLWLPHRWLLVMNLALTLNAKASVKKGKNICLALFFSQIRIET